MKNINNYCSKLALPGAKISRTCPLGSWRAKLASLQQRNQALAAMVEERSLRVDPWQLMDQATTVYQHQLDLLAGIELASQPILKNDWLIGAVGSDSQLICQILRSGGRVTATTLTANELLNMVVIAQKEEISFSQLIGKNQGISSIARNIGLKESLRSNHNSLERALQPYQRRLVGEPWQEIEIDPGRAEIFSWQNGFTFIPLDLLDVGTLAAYINCFRGGERFSGLVLKRNSEVFLHSLYPQISVESNFHALRPKEASEIKAAYERWLTQTLRGLCREETTVLVNSSDVAFALPFLLKRGFEILVPNEEIELPFIFQPGVLFSVPKQTFRLGGLDLCCSNQTYLSHKEMLGYAIALETEGGFIMLKGEAGGRLARKERELAPAQIELLKSFESFVDRSNIFQQMICDDPSAYGFRRSFS